MTFNTGRGCWNYTSKIFLIHTEVQLGNCTEKTWIHTTFSCFCLTQVSQFWITAHEGLNLAVALHIYVDMTNSIVCLTTAYGVRTKINKIKPMCVYHFSLSPYMQSRKSFKENLIPFKRNDWLVLHLPDGTIHFKVLCEVCVICIRV